MIYTVKWLEDNLGITRKTLRVYEDKALISNNHRNPINNYREFDDDDVDRIWSIRLLQGIGYSLNEIKEIMNTPNLNFYDSISKKIEELENKRAEITNYIDFAKSIRLTGMIPDSPQIGSINCSDFMKYARENWNFFKDPKASACYEMMRQEVDTDKFELSEEKISKLEQAIDQLNDYRINQIVCTINAYYQIIANLSTMDYRSEVVQSIVNQLYVFLSQQDEMKKNGEAFNKAFFAENTIFQFKEGNDIGNMNIKKYGEGNTKFIANAVAYYGGLENVK